MRVALVNGSHQSSRNSELIQKLEFYIKKYNHEIYNFGAYDEEYKLTYVEAGVLTALLLNSEAVDFVITGCSTGQGVQIVSNSFPNVICGHIENVFDAYTFIRINAGNAVSLPLNLDLNIDYDSIFDTLLKEEKGSGYPKERHLYQKQARKEIIDIKNITYRRYIDILKEIDKNTLRVIINLPGFKKYFYDLSKNNEIIDYLKTI